MSYSWVILSLVSAFTLATSDALSKKALERSDEYLVAWFRLLFSLPLLIVILVILPVPQLDMIFYAAFCLSLPLEIIAMVLYIKALKSSPLSLTLPFLSLTPVFLILVSYVVLGEKVSLQGGVGILLIAAGSYILNLHEVRKGFLQPLLAVGREKGSLFMIGVAIIYSITSSLGKLAIEHSSALFFGSLYFVTVTIVFAPLALWFGKGDIRCFIGKGRFLLLIAPGLLYTAMIVSHMIAISLTKVAYMISLKRMSLIIGIVYGYLLFREKHIRERLSGALLMFIGFVLIVTA
jgi:drug/metabolite transporter (DMT)-like permease